MTKLECRAAYVGLQPYCNRANVAATRRRTWPCAMPRQGTRPRRANRGLAELPGV